MSGHTPGPWKFIDIVGACSVHADGREVLRYDYSTDAENKANARLIAAAPDMFDTLDSICAIDFSRLTESDMAKIYEARATLREIKEAK